jgi:DNA modification methylase
VLDPFLGSGTTCTVARAYKRRSIGIEHSAELAKSAWGRIMGGMVRQGAALGQATAIFEARKASTRARKDFETVA